MISPIRARHINMGSHWSIAVLVTTIPFARYDTVKHTLGGLFVVLVVGWLAAMVLTRYRARPTPDLPRLARPLHLLIHRGLMAALIALVLVGLSGGLAGPGIAALAGGPSESAALWLSRMFYGVYLIAILHFLFNAWREAALGARVFQRLLPF